MRSRSGARRKKNSRDHTWSRNELRKDSFRSSPEAVSSRLREINHGRNNDNDRTAAAGSLSGDPPPAGDGKRDAPLDAEQSVRVRSAFTGDERRREASSRRAVQRRSR